MNDELGLLLVTIAMAMALFGLVYFWHRPSRIWWFTLTWVATISAFALAIGQMPLLTT